MAVSGFIPEIWTARILARLPKVLIFGQAGVVNRDYEGEIAQKGDTVRIGGIGDITIKPYSKNTDIDDPEELDDDMTSLVIDQADYFNFAVDDIDARQAAPNLMDAAMANAAIGMSETADGFLAAKMASEGTPVTSTETEAYDQLVDLGTALTEANIPTTDRFAAVPPWYYGLLLKDDRFVGSGSAASTEVLFNGQVGFAAGFKILQSNSLRADSGGDYPVIAGHPMATSYAEQINKVEAFRPQARFADAVKGLHLYGAKVVRPAALAVLSVSKP
ncbi:MAG TPA: hypothetical protein VFI34_07615 [Candidatus Limnocylindrales bacterium]|nr:hypothetical protein [Candidatus Limnocylindrales bacterium]